MKTNDRLEKTNSNETVLEANEPPNELISGSKRTRASKRGADPFSGTGGSKREETDNDTVIVKTLHRVLESAQLLAPSLGLPHPMGAELSVPASGPFRVPLHRFVYHPRLPLRRGTRTRGPGSMAKLKR